MRKGFAIFLAMLILLGTVFPASVLAVPSEESPVSTRPEAPAETISSLTATESTAEETTLSTEETTESTWQTTPSTEATVPTEETTVPEESTVSTEPAFATETSEIPETTSPETQTDGPFQTPTEAQTEAPPTELPAEAPTETSSEAAAPEEEKPRFSLWEWLLGFLGLLDEGGSLEGLTLSDAQGNPIALTPEFSPDCRSYGAQIPAQGDITLTLQAGEDYQFYVNGAVRESTFSLTPVWGDDGTFPVNMTLLGKGLYDEEEYTLTLVPLPPEAQCLEITQLPEKTEYESGEVFDPTGLSLKVTLDDGSTLIPEPEELTFSPAQALYAEDIAVTVTYENVSAEIAVQVTGLSGSGSSDDPYLLTCQEDLFLLDQWVTQGDSQSGRYFKLTKNIEITDPWNGIGDSTHPFSGDFNGKNFQISIPEGGRALFSFVKNGNIRNLKLYGPRIADYGLISCYQKDPQNQNYTIKITRVTLVSGTQTLYSGFLGGYASGRDEVTIKNCTIESGVVIGYDKAQSHIGSFAGEFNGIIQSCTSAARVQGVDWVGGIVGNKGQTMGGFTVENCSFSGTVSATGKCVGGIVGGGYAGTGWGLDTAPNSPGVDITGCSCTGSVSGGTGVGGILGAENCVQQFWSNGVSHIQDNRFTSSVSASGRYVGGIIGFQQSLNCNSIISNNYYKNAARGIGAVAHVDTSAVENGYREGTYYYNTAKFTPDGRGGVASYTDSINVVSLQQYIDLASIGKSQSGDNRAVSKPALNRDDDPLGVDADKLCHTDAAPQRRVTGLEIQGSCKTEYTQGEALDLTGLSLKATWNTGEVTEVAVENATVSGYSAETLGEQVVKLRYQGAEARLKVTVKPKSSDITVTVTILGDRKHGSGSAIHGLATGGLTTWASRSVKAKTTQTVWDVLKLLLDEKGLSYSASDNNQYGTVYISAVNGLGEFDNGPNSGWMYTVNGHHANRGVSAVYLKDKDKIILHYTDDYTYEEDGVNYGKSPAAADRIQNVIALIDKIGSVTYTDGCRQRIEAARSAYDALSVEDRKKVTNYDKLTAAEKAYADAEQAAEKAGAQKVIDLIKAISDPVTKSSRKAIEKARKAYDKLSPAAQKLVTNYEVLTKAEVAYAKLVATKADWEKARNVIDLIAALSAASDAKTVAAARKAYSALTNLQKLLVENHGLLELAEARLSGQTVADSAESCYQATGRYIQNLGTPSVGPIGGEWAVLGLARSGLEISGLEDYCAQAEQYIRQSVDPETQRLHRVKSTDNARMILALTAMGKDASNIAGFDLTRGLSDLEYVCYQGNNGPIWALIALDSGNYPATGTATRQALVQTLLQVQTSDGGWAVTGNQADTDMTGMALQALAPYYEKEDAVRAAVDRALDRLSAMQNDDGSFSANYGAGASVPTSESISQVITGLTALGIDPATDSRFVKKDGSALEALLRFHVDGGGFRHVSDGDRDGMATEQGYYALTAYFRFREGKSRLYDMTDLLDKGGDPADAPAQRPGQPQPEAKQGEKPVKKKSASPLLIAGVSLLVLGCGGAAALLIVGRKNGHSADEKRKQP